MRYRCQLPFYGSKNNASYIDPGSGYVLGSNFLGMLGILGGVLASGFFFLRNRFLPFLKDKKVVVGLVVLVLVAIGIMVGMGSQSFDSARDKGSKVIILGFDGMDPNILEEGWKAGRFKNLKKLRDTGYFSRLATTVPPQSPVAWASFITGKSPADHGIFDFIERDSKDYSLNLAFSNSETQKTEIKGTSFWETTTKNKIPSTILFLPDTFEPPKSLSGEMIAGMGVPDVLGTQGTFTLFTTKSYPTDDYTWRGKVISVKQSPVIKTNIEGPKYSAMGETKTTTIPLEIEESKGSVNIKLQNKTITLKKGEFSPWVRLEFKIDFFTKVKGIAKFYLKSTEPEFELYLSPINFDPEAPLKPISTPYDFSAKLVKDIGLFSTLGLPHDTWALEESVFDEKAFLTQADSILAERRKIYYSKLGSFKNGLLFAYFGMPDTISHMFWRFKDKSGPYVNTINDTYEKMDEIVGETVKKLDSDTTLIVMSDHGFSSFNYEMNVNSWLKDNGFLVLKEGSGGGPLFESVDWSETRAYAAGYNSVYFNLKGREAEGIVEKKDVPGLRKEIIGKLMEFQNPATGEKIMKHVYTREEMGIARDDLYAPDMILGFYKGTRASWDSAIGAVTDYTVRKRTGKWSGDHLFDATEVPGVIFSNKKLNINPPAGGPKIEDVMPIALKILKAVH